MTVVEGRIVIGLDEFMLRLGHVTKLVEIADGLGGGRNRVIRALSEWLTEPTPVKASQLQSVGTYMVRKKLARVRQGSREILPQQRARYSDFLVRLADDGTVQAVEPPKGSPLEIWKEDLLISDPEVPSKVGAVTVNTRDTSNKSGVSHLIDWAQALSVLDNNLNVGALGNVLLHVWRAEHALGKRNQYAISGQRLVYLWILFSADGDVLRQLVTMFPPGASLAKSDSLNLFGKAFHSIYDGAFGRDATASAAATRRVRDMRDDLGIVGGQELGTGRASTMWHRLSSRLESLVDVGVLEKVDEEGNVRPFEYVYRLTKSGVLAARTLDDTVEIDEWLLMRASDVAAGDAPSVPVPSHLVGRFLRRAISTLKSVAAVHIDSCALLAATLAALEHVFIPVGLARKLILDTATERPELARLARGHVGTRPEFVTFDTKRLENLGPDGLGAPATSPPNG